MTSPQTSATVGQTVRFAFANHAPAPRATLEERKRAELEGCARSTRNRIATLRAELNWLTINLARLEERIAELDQPAPVPAPVCAGSCVSCACARLTVDLAPAPVPAPEPVNP